jgi:hypothetical protein
MRMVSLFLSLGLLLAGLSAAASRSCEILLAAPTQAGSVLLQPGQYRVSLDGSEAVFQEVRSARSFRTAVKVEDGGAEFEKTRILTNKNAGPRRVDAIEFEGSTTKIEFQQN